MNRYVSSFAVADGAAVLTAPLGPDFPGGLLVCRTATTPEVLDGEGEPRAATNVKYLRWDEAAEAAGLRDAGP